MAWSSPPERRRRVMFCGSPFGINYVMLCGGYNIKLIVYNTTSPLSTTRQREPISFLALSMSCATRFKYMSTLNTVYGLIETRNIWNYMCRTCSSIQFHNSSPYSRFLEAADDSPSRAQGLRYLPLK